MGLAGLFPIWAGEMMAGVVKYIYPGLGFVQVWQTVGYQDTTGGLDTPTQGRKGAYYLESQKADLALAKQWKQPWWESHVPYGISYGRSPAPSLIGLAKAIKSMGGHATLLWGHGGPGCLHPVGGVRGHYCTFPKWEGTLLSTLTPPCSDLAAKDRVCFVHIRPRSK